MVISRPSYPTHIPPIIPPACPLLYILVPNAKLMRRVFVVLPQGYPSNNSRLASYNHARSSAMRASPASSSASHSSASEETSGTVSGPAEESGASMSSEEDAEYVPNPCTLRAQVNERSRVLQLFQYDLWSLAFYFFASRLPWRDTLYHQHRAWLWREHRRFG